MNNDEVQAMEVGLKSVISSFRSLADFKKQHTATIPLLNQLPIDEMKVDELQKSMP